MKEWEREVAESLYLQHLLPLHPERAMESLVARKTVLRRIPLTMRPVSGPGSMGRITPEPDGFTLSAPLRTLPWPPPLPGDGDYANFGQADACLLRGDGDWQGMNRLHLEVYPQLPGAGVLGLNVGLVLPDGDAYAREGETTFQLEPDRWNTCIYDFPELDASQAVMVRLYVLLNGQETTTAPALSYRFRQIRLEQVAAPEKYHGWQCDRLIVPLAGYCAEGRKTAIAPDRGEGDFTVLSAENAVLLRGCANPVNTAKGRFALLDFSSLCREGSYRLCYGGLETPFTLRRDLYEESLWKTLNFLYGQRCGFPVPGRHCACHLDSVAYHNGTGISYAGGWHDAGDVSQQTLQSGEVVQSLLEAAQAVGLGTALGKRLVLEAEWGLDFLLRTRFGDGFRATSAGATRWTDGKIGNADDVTVRVHDHPFENLMLAGVEAYAASVLREVSPQWASGALRAAVEDFDFGLEAYRARGVCLPSMFEHSYSSGESLYDAALTLASARLLTLTGENKYRVILRNSSAEIMACQETAGPLPGCFYRDRTHTMLMHFNHQSREHLYMDALLAAASADPDAPERTAWESAMERYGRYLKQLMHFAEPYGMLPAGLYHRDEAENEAVFRLSHLMVDYAQEKAHYVSQLQSGMPLNDRQVVRMFPVWFSFRGNTAVHLSMGRGAAVLGAYFQDTALQDIAREQVYWVLGKNPFAQVLQYGMGSRYPAQYAVFPGELAGEIPVGIQTRGDEDEPFWPQGSNATYKEVWTTASARWLALLAKLM